MLVNGIPDRGDCSQYMLGKAAFTALQRYLLVRVIFSARRRSLHSTLPVTSLSTDYYGTSCFFAEQIVRYTVDESLQKDPTLAAALLRMQIHDCFIQGCDGSVLIESTEEIIAEKDSPANLSLRGYEIINQAREILESRCPGVVSCADILAMAARDAVYWTGGPYYNIPKG